MTMLAALKWLEDHTPERYPKRPSIYAQTYFHEEDPPIGTPIIAKIISDLNGIRRHYWEA
jgi:hypothetical protein